MINLINSKIKKPNKSWEKWEIKEWEWIKKFLKHTKNKPGPLESTDRYDLKYIDCLNLVLELCH